MTPVTRLTASAIARKQRRWMRTRLPGAITDSDWQNIRRSAAWSNASRRKSASRPCRRAFPATPLARPCPCAWRAAPSVRESAGRGDRPAASSPARCTSFVYSFPHSLTSLLLTLRARVAALSRDPARAERGTGQSPGVPLRHSPHHPDCDTARCRNNRPRRRWWA